LQFKSQASFNLLAIFLCILEMLRMVPFVRYLLTRKSVAAITFHLTVSRYTDRSMQHTEETLLALKKKNKLIVHHVWIT